jgi:hypothetical protein
LSIVGEVESGAVATMLHWELSIGSLDAGTPQFGVGVGPVLCGEVELIHVRAESDLDAPLAQGGAGKDSSGGAGCESEDNGGELHLDGDGV